MPQVAQSPAQAPSVHAREPCSAQNAAAWDFRAFAALDVPALLRVRACGKLLTMPRQRCSSWRQHPEISVCPCLQAPAALLVRERRLRLRRYCQDCQAGVGTCTVCKEQGRAGIDVFKCRLPSCGHFYHGSCLQDIQPHFASRLMRHAPALRQLLPPSSAASHRARGPPRRLTQISGFRGA